MLQRGEMKVVALLKVTFPHQSEDAHQWNWWPLSGLDLNNTSRALIHALFPLLANTQMWLQPRLDRDLQEKLTSWFLKSLQCWLPLLERAD